MKKKLYTVAVFAKFSTKRFFRDKLAIFFGILFPLIFLLVLGGLNRGGDLNFGVAVINRSDSVPAAAFVKTLEDNKTFDIKSDLTDYDAAKERMIRNQLDAIIVLPPTYGQSREGIPGGQAEVYYTQNNTQAGTTLVTIINGLLERQNQQITAVQKPFVAEGRQLSDASLSGFDYAFAGLLGFAIIGIGIFGPVNVFPELKKAGILRRLHTTPLRVWQYFMATAISQTIVGLVSVAVMFAAAITIFDLKVLGSWPEIALFTAFSIIMILGIGLAIGGWARNERQAAPLSNLIVFPMLFLSGTFFPRFAMPEWLQQVSNFLPLTPVIDGIRLLTTEGLHLVNILPQLGLMAAWMVVIYALAFRLFRWE